MTELAELFDKNPNRSEPKHQLPVRFPASILRTIEDEAEAQNVSMAEIVRRATENGLDQVKQ